jgi:hypothetical protein
MRRAAGATVAALAALAGFAWAGLVAAPAGACACGIAIEATVTEESALLIERPGGEQLILSLDLAGDGSTRPAVVLPVPGVPEVAAIERGDPLAYLDQATAAEPTTGAAPGSGEDTAGAPPVDVIGREQVGGYDVARLASGDAAALDRWLNQNGYLLPTGADEILAEYVDEGWRFVAIRLAREAEGRLRPLVVSFDTDELVYPMRLAQLGDAPVNLTLYTLADGPREVASLAPVWEGEVAELSPPPPAELAEIFNAGGYLTRLEGNGLDPAAFTADLVAEPASVSGLEAGQTAVPTDDGDGGVPTGGVIAIIVAGLAFALGLSLLTRR